MEFEEILNKTKNYQLAYYIQAAQQLGINWKILIPGTLVEFSYKNMTWRQLKSISPLNDSVSATLAMYKNTCNQFLHKNGFSVPKQIPVKKVDDIYQFKTKNNINDIVIKPVRGFGGKGVTILPKNDKEIADAFKLAESKSLSKSIPKVVVEEFIKGNNYRLLVLGNQVIAAVLREPAKVTGDGKHSLILLINKNNVDMKEIGLEPVELNQTTEKVLISQGFNSKSIPKSGQIVYLRNNCNLSTGGTTTEYLSKVSKYFKNIAIEATKTSGLLLSGVDIITPDITNPNSKYAINEINHNPGLRPHYLPDKGKPVDVAYLIQEFIIKHLSK